MTLTKGELKWSDQNISKTGLFKAHRIVLRIPRIEKKAKCDMSKDQNEEEKQKKQGVH